jgi:hypothetical protein
MSESVNREFKKGPLMENGQNYSAVPMDTWWKIYAEGGITQLTEPSVENPSFKIVDPEGNNFWVKITQSVGTGSDNRPKSYVQLVRLDENGDTK